MIEEKAYQQYLKALLAGKRDECRSMVREQLNSGISIKDIYKFLFHRSMYEVGELWENNRITVANEHLATSITESLMALMYPAIFSTERSGKSAIISCVANEYHQVGGKMASDILELNGWDVKYLGANTPPDDMEALIQETHPDLVGLSLSILSNLGNLDNNLSLIKTDFPNMNLLVGGQAFQRGGLDTVRKYKGVDYVPTLDQLEQIINAH